MEIGLGYLCGSATEVDEVLACDERVIAPRVTQRIDPSMRLNPGSLRLVTEYAT